MAKKFTLYLAEEYSEPFQVSKQGGYLLEVAFFAKSSTLYVWQGSEYSIAHWIIKTSKPHNAKSQNVATLRQGT